MLETVHKNLYWNETSLENNFSLDLFPESKNEMKIIENAAYEYCIYISLLKVVSVTFLLVSFASLKENTCEKRKNGFYFTSKARFVLEIIKF